MQIIEGQVLLNAVMGLPGWSLEDGELVRQFTFKSFSGAMVFVNRVAELAELADHHPDIDIRWNKVRLTLSTHSAGGITEKDITLALRIGETQQD